MLPWSSLKIIKQSANCLGQNLDNRNISKKSSLCCVSTQAQHISHNCDDQPKINVFVRSSNIWHFIYSFTFFTFYGYITNSQCDQLPDGLIAQSVENCTGIAEVMGSNPVQAWMFFSGFNFTTAQVVCITVMINKKLMSFSAVQIYDISYIHSHISHMLWPDSFVGLLENSRGKLTQTNRMKWTAKLLSLVLLSLKLIWQSITGRMVCLFSSSLQNIILTSLFGPRTIFWAFLAAKDLFLPCSCAIFSGIQWRSV